MKTDTPDHELLRQYAQGGSEAAFAQLVERHCDLVWGAARRVSGHDDVAQDVAQMVFADLARKATQLAKYPILAGWLYRAACHAAANQVRGAVRRTQREYEAMQMNPPESDNSADRAGLEELQPVLDDAVASLNEADREVLVLRYFSRRSLAEVGSTLGTNEDAAQKRVSRALEKLREAFRQRGVAVPSGAVAAALSFAGTQVAPTGLAATACAAALAQAGATAGGFLSLIALMKSKLAIGITGSAVVVTTLLWQQHRLGRLAEANQVLRQQITAMTAAAEASPSPPADAGELARLRDQQAELLRLRGEVARLRQTAAARPQGPENTEGRLAQAETQAAAIKAEIAFRNRRILVIDAGKNLGLAARLFANDHGDQVPTKLPDLQSYLPLSPEGTLSGGVSPEMFEFFPQPRAFSFNEPHLILFREREARAIPPGALSPEDLAEQPYGSAPLQQGWERAYVLMDGSVQSYYSPTGDFSEYERQGTATVPRANATAGQ